MKNYRINLMNNQTLYKIAKLKFNKRIMKF